MLGFKRFAVGAAVASLAVAITACGGGSNDDGATQATAVAAGGVSVPQVKVNYGNAGFIDHTDAILAVDGGFFKDVGITIGPGEAGAVYDPAEHAAVMLGNKVDVQSTNYQILLPALAKTKNLRMFAYGDFFIGFALMGKKEFKSYQEFTTSGMSGDEALKAAVDQMNGKTLTWSPDPAVRNFGRTVMLTGGLQLSDVKQESLNDAQGVQLMLSDRADFQVGGAPSRITLEKAGFKPIVTAADLTGLVKPPYEGSQVLAAVSTNGWGTTEEYWRKNQDTILRMTSVKWRISKLIHDRPAETAPLHVRFLNRSAGTDLKPEDAEVIYRSVDPYIPAEEQGPLWFTPGKPTYEPTMIQAALNQAYKSGVLPKDSVDAASVTIAPEVYARMMKLKQEADTILKAVGTSSDAEVKKLVDAARHYYEIYDYLDAQRFAKAAQELAG